MKKKMLIVIGLVLLILFVVSKAFAGGVTDDNNGNAGDILVSNGTNNGANSVGTWTDPSFLKGEKGDKGDKGDTGDQGIQGEKGDTGATGAKGDKGDTGATGENGQDGLNGKDGEKGDKGDKGDRGEKGKDFDKKVSDNLQDQINELNDPKYYLVPQVRIHDSEKLEIKPYAKFDINDNLQFKEAGLKVTLKVGKSHEEKLIAEQTLAINQLKAQMNLLTADVTTDENGNIVRIKD